MRHFFCFTFLFFHYLSKRAIFCQSALSEYQVGDEENVPLIEFVKTLFQDSARVYFEN